MLPRRLKPAGLCGRHFIDWYLDQARATKKSEGKRLIDYLDLHWYPEAQGGGQRVIVESRAPEVIKARVQAPRSLWDPIYEETSWVRDRAGGPIQLLNWLKTKIDAHYPGTKLAFTEWNFGASIDRKNLARTVIIAINKGIAKRAGRRIWQASNYRTANVFVLSGPRAEITAASTLKAVAKNAFVYDMPPESVSILVPNL